MPQMQKGFFSNWEYKQEGDFNWAAATGRFFLMGGIGYTYSGYHKPCHRPIMVKTTIMIKTEQVSHSKQETISIILTQPSRNPSATQNIA